MSFYGNAQNTTSKALTKFGHTCTHTIRTAGTYNPAAGGVTVSETTQSVKAALFDYKTQMGGTQEIGGTLILAGDKKALIAAKNITAPKVDDTLTVGSVVWTIKNVKELNPAGTSIMFELQVRK